MKKISMSMTVDQLQKVIMKRRYVYLNIILTVTALFLPYPFLKFGNYSEGKYTSAPQNMSTVSSFAYIVPSFRELEKYLREFSQNYSLFATLYELGEVKRRNVENFPIYNMVLSTGYAKPIIVIIGGIYGSDLTLPLIMTQCFSEWIIDLRLLGKLLPFYDYHFIPLINPEGYDYVYKMHIKGKPLFWLKNKKSQEGISVNLLNNFESHFNSSSKSSEDDHFGGFRPFSEPETCVIRDYFSEIKDNVAAVFLLFSSSKEDAITYPYAHTLEKHESWILQEKLAAHAFDDTKTTSGNIPVRSAAEYGGVEAGRMDDWLMETLQKSFVLNIQLAFTLRAPENSETLNNLSRNARKILKRLIIGSYSDEYLKYQERLRRIKQNMYHFSWRKIKS